MKTMRVKGGILRCTAVELYYEGKGDLRRIRVQLEEEGHEPQTFLTNDPGTNSGLLAIQVGLVWAKALSLHAITCLVNTPVLSGGDASAARSFCDLIEHAAQPPKWVQACFGPRWCEVLCNDPGIDGENTHGIFSYISRPRGERVDVKLNVIGFSPGNIGIYHLNHGAPGHCKLIDTKKELCELANHLLNRQTTRRIQWNGLDKLRFTPIASVSIPDRAGLKKAIDCVSRALLLPKTVTQELRTAIEAQKLPRLLYRSFHHLSVSCRAKPDITRAICQSGKLGLAIAPIAPMTSEPDWMEIQMELHDFSKTLFHERRAPFDLKDFISFVHAERAAYQRIVYHFPFAYHEQRVNLWGILPYGVQHSIGVLVHSNHPAVKKRQFKGDSITLVPKDAQSFLIDVMLEAERNPAACPISSVAGSGQREVLETFFLAKLEYEALVAMGRWHTPIQSLDYGAFVRGLVQGTKEPSTPAHFFDPLFSEYFKSPPKSGWISIHCQHDMEIPVGVGFTLSVLPALLHENKWQRLWDKAYSVYKPHEERLKRLGIELKPQEYFQGKH